MQKPFVSVKTITYNHEKFIAQCIEGIMMQKTNFSFEFIIGEDCSTDNTMKIIQEYADRYPDVIRVITSENNVGAAENDHRTDLECQGKYVAFCEGDDFWTDPHKLQKQVDFLEANPEYGMIHSSFSCLNGQKLIHDVWQEKDMLQGDLLDHLITGNCIATATVCMRNELLQNIRIGDQVMGNEWKMGDYPLWIEVSAQSKIAYMADDTMTYRIHSDSATHSLDLNGDFKFFKSRYEIKNFYVDKFNRKNLTPFLERMYYKELLKYAIFFKDEVLRKACLDYFTTSRIRNELPYLLFSKYAFLAPIFRFVYSFRKKTQTLI